MKLPQRCRGCNTVTKILNMKNNYSLSTKENSESKNIFRTIVSKAKQLILLLLVPASMSAQDLECCVLISSQPDQANPYLVHFCISPCNEENSFEIYWDFGDGSPLVFSSDTCITHQYPAPAGKFNVCISSTMCLPGGVTCEYDTCITVVVGGSSNVGMNEVSGANFMFDVFPNPASGFINIYSESKISSIEILNLLGEKIVSCEAKSGYTRIPVNNISAGTYWVKIISPNQKPKLKKIQINK
jgi:hypothetical protein